MHQFLKSIGFREYHTRKQEQDLLKLVRKEADASCLFYDSQRKCQVGYYRKEIAKGMGVILYGEFDNSEDDSFQPMYYYPFVDSQEISGENVCDICRHSFLEDFIANCDDYRFGVTLIFHVMNQAELRLAMEKEVQNRPISYELSALAHSGKILMPILKTPIQIEEAKKEAKMRSRLIEKAKNGNEEAIETLTMSEMNTFSRMNRLVEHNDIYSLIDSYFMPNGMECDMYSIMGDILELQHIQNSMTQEWVYCMLLDCNDVPMKVTINEADLLGVPEVGRRFKGIVWMQGYLNFDKK